MDKHAKYNVSVRFGSNGAYRTYERSYEYKAPSIAKWAIVLCGIVVILGFLAYANGLI